MTEGERNVEQREQDVEHRERDVEHREDVLDTRDTEADRAAFLSSDPDYGDRLPIRRHAATDRVNAKDDRHHSADDREKLTQNTVEEPDESSR